MLFMAVDTDLTVQITIIDDLFKRYILMVYGDSDSTDIFCKECESFVGSYETETLKELTENELLSKIVSDHSEQVMGETVSFDVGI